MDGPTDRDRGVPLCRVLTDAQRTRVPAALLALSGLSALAGCGETDSGGSAEADSSVPASRSASVEPSEPSDDECSAEPPVGDALTEPGTVLCLGTPAVLPLLSDDDVQMVTRVRVTAIEQVPAAVLEAVDQEDIYDELDMTQVDVYTVSAEVELLSGAMTPRTGDRLDPFDLLTLASDGTSSSDWPGQGWPGATWEPEGCDYDTFPDDTPPGETIETCEWLSVPRGEVITGAVVGSGSDAYNYYQDGAGVTWPR